MLTFTHPSNGEHTLSYGTRRPGYGRDEHPQTSELRDAERDARNHGETASAPTGSYLGSYRPWDTSGRPNSAADAL